MKGTFPTHFPRTKINNCLSNIRKKISFTLELFLQGIPQDVTRIDKTAFALNLITAVRMVINKYWK